jgi:hypothetical protein
VAALAMVVSIFLMKLIVEDEKERKLLVDFIELKLNLTVGIRTRFE